MTPPMPWSTACVRRPSHIPGVQLYLQSSQELNIGGRSVGDAVSVLADGRFGR